VAQLGAGLVGAGQISYPNVVDSHQTFVNGSPLIPDGATRFDAELIMDILRTLINIETTLGANVQGVFGSLAARLNQFLPGSGGLPGIVTFTNSTLVSIPGTTHNVGQAALLWQLYDANIPANAMGPGSVQMQVDPLNYDVFLNFSVPTSGMIAIGATSPIYVASFSNTNQVTVLGTTHLLGTSDLLYQVYDNGSPRRTAMEPGSLTVHPTSHNVVMTFTSNQSGLLVLGAARYGTTFSGVQQITIPGTTHMLGTSAIVFQAYDSASPRAALGDPGVTVNPSSYDVTVNFGVTMSGRFVLDAASTLTGREFDIRDAGLINQSAVRMRSSSGTLHLQAGAGERVYIENKINTARVTVDTQQGFVGIGTSTPAHQLHLTTGDAVMAGGGPWLAPSDERQKEAIRAFEDGLGVVLQLEPVRYRYNGLGGIPRSDEDRIGLIAQAIQRIAPYMVRSYRGRLRPEDPEDTDLLILDPNALPYLLVNALKTMHARLAEETAARQEMRAQVAELAQRLTRLEEARP
jgi:Chaperone of endosialidase